MADKKYKLKHWWWYIFPPSQLDIDRMILEMSMSNPIENAEVIEKLLKEFMEKYYVLKISKEKNI